MYQTYLLKLMLLIFFKQSMCQLHLKTDFFRLKDQTINNVNFITKQFSDSIVPETNCDINYCKMNFQKETKMRLHSGTRVIFSLESPNLKKSLELELEVRKAITTYGYDVKYVAPFWDLVYARSTKVKEPFDLKDTHYAGTTTKYTRSDNVYNISKMMYTEEIKDINDLKTKFICGEVYNDLQVKQLAAVIPRPNEGSIVYSPSTNAVLYLEICLEKTTCVNGVFNQGDAIELPEYKLEDGSIVKIDFKGLTSPSFIENMPDLIVEYGVDDYTLNLQNFKYGSTPAIGVTNRDSIAAVQTSCVVTEKNLCSYKSIDPKQFIFWNLKKSSSDSNFQARTFSDVSPRLTNSEMKKLEHFYKTKARLEKSMAYISINGRHKYYHSDKDDHHDHNSNEYKDLISDTTSVTNNNYFIKIGNIIILSLSIPSDYKSEVIILRERFRVLNDMIITNIEKSEILNDKPGFESICTTLEAFIIDYEECLSSNVSSAICLNFTQDLINDIITSTNFLFNLTKYGLEDWVNAEIAVSEYPEICEEQFPRFFNVTRSDINTTNEPMHAIFSILVGIVILAGILTAILTPHFLAKRNSCTSDEYSIDVNTQRDQLNSFPNFDDYRQDIYKLYPNKLTLDYSMKPPPLFVNYTNYENQEAIIVVTAENYKVDVRELQVTITSIDVKKCTIYIQKSLSTCLVEINNIGDAGTIKIKTNSPGTSTLKNVLNVWNGIREYNIQILTPVAHDIPVIMCVMDKEWHCAKAQETIKVGNPDIVGNKLIPEPGKDTISGTADFFWDLLNWVPSFAAFMWIFWIFGLLFSIVLIILIFRFCKRGFSYSSRKLKALTTMLIVVTIIQRTNAYYCDNSAECKKYNVLCYDSGHQLATKQGFDHRAMIFYQRSFQWSVEPKFTTSGFPFWINNEFSDQDAISKITIWKDKSPLIRGSWWLNPQKHKEIMIFYFSTSESTVINREVKTGEIVKFPEEGPINTYSQVIQNFKDSPYRSLQIFECGDNNFCRIDDITYGTKKIVGVQEATKFLQSSDIGSTAQSALASFFITTDSFTLIKIFTFVKCGGLSAVSEVVSYSAVIEKLKDKDQIGIIWHNRKINWQSSSKVPFIAIILNDNTLLGSDYLKNLLLLPDDVNLILTGNSFFMGNAKILKIWCDDCTFNIADLNIKVNSGTEPASGDACYFSDGKISKAEIGQGPKFSCICDGEECMCFNEELFITAIIKYDLSPKEIYHDNIKMNVTTLYLTINCASNSEGMLFLDKDGTFLADGGDLAVSLNDYQGYSIVHKGNPIEVHSHSTDKSDKINIIGQTTYEFIRFETNNKTTDEKSFKNAYKKMLKEFPIAIYVTIIIPSSLLGIILLIILMKCWRKCKRISVKAASPFIQMADKLEGQFYQNKNEKTTNNRNYGYNPNSVNNDGKQNDFNYYVRKRKTYFD